MRQAGAGGADEDRSRVAEAGRGTVEAPAGGGIGVSVEVEAAVAGRLDHDDAATRGQSDGVEVGFVDLGGQASELHLEQQDVARLERSGGRLHRQRLCDGRRHVAVGAPERMVFILVPVVGGEGELAEAGGGPLDALGALAGRRQLAEDGGAVVAGDALVFGPVDAVDEARQHVLVLEVLVAGVPVLLEVADRQQAGHLGAGWLRARRHAEALPGPGGADPQGGVVEVSLVLGEGMAAPCRLGIAGSELPVGQVHLGQPVELLHHLFHAAGVLPQVEPPVGVEAVQGREGGDGGPLLQVPDRLDGLGAGQRPPRSIPPRPRPLPLELHQRPGDQVARLLLPLIELDRRFFFLEGQLEHGFETGERPVLAMGELPQASGVRIDPRRHPHDDEAAEIARCDERMRRGGLIAGLLAGRRPAAAAAGVDGGGCAAGGVDGSVRIVDGRHHVVGARVVDRGHHIVGGRIVDRRHDVISGRIVAQPA